MVDVAIPGLGTELIIYDLEMNENSIEIIPEQGELVFLRNLWFTSLGYEVLSKFDLGLRTKNERIREDPSRIQKGRNQLSLENGERTF
jgi:hypothetical protein